MINRPDREEVPDTPTQADSARALLKQRPTHITCGGCTNTWTAPTAAHCATCHQTFSNVRLFDLHRSQEGEHGACINPITLTRNGQALITFRNGMWRGPAMSAEALERRRGQAV